jgi:two-component system sensor histidine kinase CpxA
MRSILVRIFLAFWLIIAITIGTAAIIGYSYSQIMREAFESFEASDIMLEASSNLQSGGREGLEHWLRELPDDMNVAVFVIDGKGQELLGRRIPYSIEIAMRRFGSDRDRSVGSPPDSNRLRPARPLTRLIGPDDRVYTFFATPKRGRGGDWLNEQTWMYFLILALLVSGGVSYLLARAVSRPVSRFREAAVAIAAGNFDTRVTEFVGARKDEIGHLARDFDRMADELQRAWHQKTELTRNVSHELRSPLARLRVALELARREAGDLPEFARIEKETERLDELIGQILDYAKMEAGTGEEPAQIELGDLIQLVVDDVEYECRSAGVEGVTVELSIEGSPSTNGFAIALSSAIENVLRNAVHHSPANRPVSVTLSQTTTHALIEISDQGSGVDETELESLFEPFFRSSSALNGGRKNGTGLGLAIARRAVKKNGGTISASNIADGGLRVTIELPFELVRRQVI